MRMNHGKKEQEQEGGEEEKRTAQTEAMRGWTMDPPDKRR